MKGNHLRRQAAILVCFLAVYAVLSVIADFPLVSARAAAYKTGSNAATPSSALASSEIMVPTPSSASPDSPTITPTSSVPDKLLEINYLDAPNLIVLEAGQADSTSWESHFPGQAQGWTAESRDVLCGLQWSVSHIRWDRPGLYTASANVLLPDGYILSEYLDKHYDAVVSIHPPGKSQVMDVYTSMGFWGLRGHTWTFAMKAGQDMTPLIEELESKTDYLGILDTTNETIHFTADWDFSAVNPRKPGLYHIRRRLSLVEDNLPEGLSPEDIFLPDYWKELSVLFSVEEPGGPQLYGALENPYEFFGSYAKLSDEELNILEVWYSIDGSPWTLQTDEALMETEQRNFRIFKSEMETGKSYSFRLKLGTHTSRELTVKKAGNSPVWFSWTLGGNRDGTIDIDFPDISQPPPEIPDINGTLPPETGETTRPEDEETLPPETGETTKPEDEGTLPPETGETTKPEDEGTLPPESDGAAREDDDENGETAPPESSESPPPENENGQTDPPEEIVTRWTSQISGKRVRKLVEMYSEWILFQKEDVSVLVSSEWLEEQQLKDSDILTVKVSPEADHTVTVLINQKVPEDEPVCQVEIHTSPVRQPAAPNTTALCLFLIGCSGAFLYVKWRWKK